MANDNSGDGIIMKNFALIGDGAIAKYHRKAIEHVGGKLSCIYDPDKYPENINIHDLTPIVSSIIDIRRYFHPCAQNYCVICSPSNFHRSQIQFILKNFPATTQIICEKPAFLPWEQPILDDRINIVLQLRYLPNLPESADKISVRFVRDDSYFQSWKGNPKKTGGLFYSLFIHYIDLAQRLNADFEGIVQGSGIQCRKIQKAGISDYDILNINMQGCYNLLYENILNGNGIKPTEISYLAWSLYRNSEIFGYGKNGINKTINIGHELL
uniref:Putative oxidoreductase family protein n=1 Tax=viral metagenome TaxID=1070528 RepID=A0A6M3JHR9_9ZZZZ